MFCSNCGTQNDDTSKFCASCGTPIQASQAPDQAPPMAPPPMAAPGMAAPPPPPPGMAPPPMAKPYKTEFALGLTGSIIGIVIFLIALIVGIVVGGVASYGYYGYGYGNTLAGALIAVSIVGAIFILVAFILGFVGTSQVGKGNGKGGIMLIVGGGLGFIAMFMGIAGWTSIFFFPLLLTAGIMALARRNKVESGIY